jgi:hypothetical protein
MRFTLGKLFIAVALLALAFAGMMYRTSLWSSGIWTLTWALFLLATVQAVGAVGKTRVTAIAFVIGGTAYLVFYKWWVFSSSVLLTNLFLAWIARFALRDLRDADEASIIGLGLDSSYGNEELSVFFTIGHCIFAWLIAFLAAWFAGRIYDRRDRPTKAT